MTPSKRVTVIGDALIDELQSATGTESFVGGAALNVAVGLSILGVDTTLIAMVGADEAGTAIRSYLSTFGVQLIESPSRFGTSRAVSDRTDGEPTYTFNEAAQNRVLDYGEAARASIADASLVVVSCYPFDSDEQSRLLEEAVTDPASRLIIDPNPRAGMLSDRERFTQNFERIAARSLLVKVGDDDAALLYNCSLALLTERLQTLSAAAILATAGKDGASIADAEGHTASAAIAQLPGPIVDTMGAGDATLASITASLLAPDFAPADEGWQRSLDRAMTIAAATCRHQGAQLRLP